MACELKYHDKITLVSNCVPLLVVVNGIDLFLRSWYGKIFPYSSSLWVVSKPFYFDYIDLEIDKPAT